MENSRSTTKSSSLITAQKFEPTIITHKISLVLDESNFIIWKPQVSATIRGYGLHRFISDDSVIPPKFNNEEDERIGKISDEFSEWKRQDQLLLAWMLSCISESVLIRLLRCDSALKVWETLHNFFTSRYKAKIRQFRSKLWNTKKGALSMNEYLLQFTIAIIHLNFIGSPVSESDHISAILEGLPQEYDALVMSVWCRFDSFSVLELESLLLAQESRIEKNSKAIESISVNLAQSARIQ